MAWKVVGWISRPNLSFLSVQEVFHLLTNPFPNDGSDLLDDPPTI